MRGSHRLLLLLLPEVLSTLLSTTGTYSNASSMKDSKSDSDGVTVRRPRRRPRPPLEERPGGGGERTEPAAPDTRTTKTRRVAHTQTDENNDSNDTRTIVPATPTTPIPWTHTATEPTPTTAASATRWFRVAAATTSQASFWKRHDHCISGLVAASAALCASQKKKNQTISPNSSCSEEQNQDDDAPLLKIFTTAVQHDILVSCRSVVADLTASAAAATTSKTIAAAASSSSSSKSSANTSINRNSKHLKELSSNTTTAASSKSSTSSSTTTAARINALYVAVHGLRAVLYCIVTTTSNAHSNNLTHDHLPASVGSKNTEGIIRLLYHCILSAASMAAAAVESPTRTTATTITRSEEHGRGSSWLDLCGAAYQALGAAFRNYSSIPLLAASTTTIPKNNSNAGSSANWAFAVVPPPPSFNNTDNADNPADDNDTFLLKEEDNPFLGFPVPQWQQSSLELGPPPRQPQQEQTSGQKQQQQQIEQFASMGIAATLAASRVLAAHATSTTKDDAGAPLNQSSDHTLAQQPTRITKTAPAPTRITRQSSVPLLRHLIKQTSMSWMVFAASSLPRDKTVTNGKSTPKPDTTAAARDFAVHTKDESVVDDVSLLEPAAIAAHCKVAHRILWSLGAADESLEWRDTVLLLRQDAIQALFLHGGRIYSCNAPSATANATTSTDTSMYASDAVMTVLRESHFETACTQSWKVAEAYAATESSKLPRTPETRCLRQFHENVGSLLDASAKSTTTTTLTNDIPTSYAEYCAYRALHTTRNDRNVVHDICGSSDCLFRCFRYPPPYHTTCRQSAHCAHDRKNTAVLAAFFLSLHVRQCIVDGVDSTAEALATEGKLERVHVIIKNFQSLVLRARSDTATDDAISELRLYKLFSSVNLHRAVSNVLGDKEKAEVSSLSTVKYGKMFRLAASILGNCIGPFYLDLLSRVEKKHSSVLFALGTSSLRLAIATSEALNCDVTVPSTDPQLKAWMETLVKISIDVPCIDHQQRLDNCENHAKVRMITGKGIDALFVLSIAIASFSHHTFVRCVASFSTRWARNGSNNKEKQKRLNLYCLL